MHAVPFVFIGLVSVGRCLCVELLSQAAAHSGQIALQISLAAVDVLQTSLPTELCYMKMQSGKKV